MECIIRAGHRALHQWPPTFGAPFSTRSAIQPPNHPTTHLPYHCSAAFVPLSVLQRSPQSAHHSCPRQDVIFAQGRNGTARSPSFPFPFFSSQPFIQPRTHINGWVRQVHWEKSCQGSIKWHQHFSKLSCLNVMFTFVLEVKTFSETFSYSRST